MPCPKCGRPRCTLVIESAPSDPLSPLCVGVFEGEKPVGWVSLDDFMRVANRLEEARKAAEARTGPQAL